MLERWLVYDKLRLNFFANGREIDLPFTYQPRIQSTVPIYDVAACAAVLLPKLSRSKEVVMALDAAVADPRESLAVNAARSLLELHATGWVWKAIPRLPKMDSVAQIQLSGLLAKAGHADGWEFVARGITSKMAPVALEAVDYFQGLVTKNGKRIDVSDELDVLKQNAPVEVQTQIAKKILQLRSAPEPRHPQR